MPSDNKGIHKASDLIELLAETSRDLIKKIDWLYKFVEKQAKESGEKGLTKFINELDEQRKETVEQLKLIRYFFKQAHWLQARFPDAQLADVEGLVKLVDFEETLRDIHIELKSLNEEATTLRKLIFIS